MWTEAIAKFITQPTGICNKGMLVFNTGIYIDKKGIKIVQEGPHADNET